MKIRLQKPRANGKEMYRIIYSIDRIKMCNVLWCGAGERWRSAGPILRKMKNYIESWTKGTP